MKRKKIPPALVHPVDTNISSSSGVGGSSSSLEDNILNLNQRLEEFFLISTTRREEVTSLIRGLDSRISNSCIFVKNQCDNRLSLSIIDYP